MNTNLRCALYVRVSTAEQAIHGKSLQAQRECLENYAASHGMIVVGLYADEGKTARKELKKRKEIHRLLKDVERGEIDVILFWRMDRWFRSVSDFYKVQDVLDAHGVRWVAVSEPNMNMETRDGRLNLNIMLSIGQNEVDTTSERIKFTVDSMVRNGRAIWGGKNLPLGYMVGEVDGKKCIVKNPEEEKIVEEVFSFFMTHQNKRKTILHIQEKFGINFSYSRLRTMLSSEFYIGKYRDNSKYCPAYLTLEEWEKIQNISKRNIRVPRSDRVYLFSGLIRCPECGTLLCGCGSNSIINRKTGEKRMYTYYRCYRGISENRCAYHHRVSQNMVEKHLLDNLETEYRKYQIRIHSIEEVSQENVGRPAAVISSEMERLNILFQKGRVSFEYYEEQYASLEDELKNSYPSPAPKKDHSQIESLLDQDIKEIYNELSSEGRQAFWRGIIERIYVDGRGLVTNVDFL